MGAQPERGVREVRLLLDTHVLFWLDTDPDRLSARALELVRDSGNPVYVSAVTAWELTIKHRLGRLASAEALLADYHSSLARYGFTDLPFSSTHALAERGLTGSHGDPFDRALVSQALVEGLDLVSADPELARFREVDVLW
jgi:PIN domain nuclease of toxin-antitoxin system